MSKIQWKPVIDGGRDVEGEGYTISLDSPLVGGDAYLWKPGAGVDDFEVFDTLADAKRAAENHRASNAPSV